MLDNEDREASRSLSVKEALGFVGDLSGKYVSIHGQLHLDFEATRVDHLPRSDSPLNELGFSLYSVWVEFGRELLLDRHGLAMFGGRHVCVAGVLHAAEHGCGVGHLGGWSAVILVESLEKWKKS